MISFLLNDVIATWATRWRWLGALRASRSSSACFAITNKLRTSVQLNGDLDWICCNFGCAHSEWRPIDSR
jgi:hypothetical protein